jgi:glucose/arabinose dehydrogenase
LRYKYKKALAITAICGLAPVVALSAAAGPAVAMPTGFIDQVVLRGLENPTSVDFSQDGRVFVGEKSGLIKVFDGLGDTTPSVFADLRTNTHNFWDRGLTSIALAPTFPEDPSVYVLYTYDSWVGGQAPRWGAPGATGDDCPNPPGATVNGCEVSGRLSKLDATKPGGGPEKVLVWDWCQQFPSHSTGDLQFGPDGYLYASAGDGAQFQGVDYGHFGEPKNPCGDPPTGIGGIQTKPTAEGGALRAQDIQTMNDPLGLDGSVIRIDPVTGQGAPGNPLINSSDPNARRMIATGMRNPYRFAFRGNELWMADVGQSSWEEIDRLVSPTGGTIDNYGWPCMEGPGRAPSYANEGLNLCERVYNGTVPTAQPYFSYPHRQKLVPGDGCVEDKGSALAGLAFYNGTSYGPGYNGAMFFADFTRHCLFAMLPGTNGLPDPAKIVPFRSGVNPVDLTAGPNGDIFYVDYHLGEVHRIRNTTGANQPPTAAIAADPKQGNLPLTVSFSAAASNDPEDKALTYAWDLDGDGDFDDAGTPTVSRTYTTAKVYKVGVRVTDEKGESDTAFTQIFAGTTAPTAAINAPDPLATWKVGDTITFNGSATDAEEGPLPASALTWKTILHHCVTIDKCHEHEMTTYTGVPGASFAAPDHEYPAYIELRLTATDNTGASSTVSRKLMPQVSNLTVESFPTGLTATVNSTALRTPFTLQAIVNSRTALSTADPQIVGTRYWGFRNWSDGGSRAHDVIIGPADKTYKATFACLPGQGPPPGSTCVGRG